MSNKPDGFTDAQWHVEASNDAGVDHARYPRQYVIKCEWCDHISFGDTRAIALQRFDWHRDEWLKQYEIESETEGCMP